MTRRLILMRHAKSSWGDPAQDDHERPLNGRGRRSAEALGAWFRAENIQPDQILVSSAQRTIETCERLNLTLEKTVLDRLYHASPGAMRQVLKQATGQCVLMLGHNPGIAWLARDLVAIAPDHPRFGDYPTGATLVVDFAIENWQDLKPGSGTVISFITPRELIG